MSILDTLHFNSEYSPSIKQILETIYLTFAFIYQIFPIFFSGYEGRY